MNNSQGQSSGRQPKNDNKIISSCKQILKNVLHQMMTRGFLFNVKREIKKKNKKKSV